MEMLGPSLSSLSQAQLIRLIGSRLSGPFPRRAVVRWGEGVMEESRRFPKKNLQREGKGGTGKKKKSKKKKGVDLED